MADMETLERCIEAIPGVMRMRNHPSKPQSLWPDNEVAVAVARQKASDRGETAMSRDEIIIYLRKIGAGLDSVFGTRCVHCGMPLTDGECTRCFPAKTMPSRDMLIRQAILNWLGIHMPMCVKEFGAVETLRRVESLWGDPLYFGRGVRQHFAALMDKYGEPKCPSF